MASKLQTPLHKRSDLTHCYLSFTPENCQCEKHACALQVGSLLSLPDLPGTRAASLDEPTCACSGTQEPESTPKHTYWRRVTAYTPSSRTHTNASMNSSVAPCSGPAKKFTHTAWRQIPTDVGMSYPCRMSQLASVRLKLLGLWVRPPLRDDYGLTRDILFAILAGGTTPSNQRLHQPPYEQENAVL